jgi:hypothetical protein
MPLAVGPSVIRVLVRVAAVRRLVELVVDDEVTKPLREWVDGRWPRSRLSYLVHCNRCVSVWAGFVVVAAPAWLVDALAYSAATILADEWRAERGARALERRVRASMGTASRPGAARD